MIHDTKSNILEHMLDSTLINGNKVHFTQFVICNAISACYCTIIQSTEVSEWSD